MYCVHCGKEIPDNAEFCSYCGKSQIHNRESKQSTDINNKTVNVERRGKIAKLPIVIATVAVIAIAIAVTVFVSTRGDSDNSSKDANSTHAESGYDVPLSDISLYDKNGIIITAKGFDYVGEIGGALYIEIQNNSSQKIGVRASDEFKINDQYRTFMGTTNNGITDIGEVNIYAVNFEDYWLKDTGITSISSLDVSLYIDSYESNTGTGILDKSDSVIIVIDKNRDISTDESVDTREIKSVEDIYDGNDSEPMTMINDDPDAKERYEELLVEFARDGSELVGSIDDLKYAKQYPIKDEVVNGSFCDGVIQIDDFVLYMDGRMTILDAIEKIAASEESANYRIEEYGIEDTGYVVPGTYTVCQRVTINVYRGKDGGFTMYGLNDKPSDMNRSPANFRLVDVIWTHLAKYAMGIDGSSWEYQYDYDKEIFDKLPSMYPVEADWILDRYKQPGDCYIFQRDTNNFTDSYRMHCVANNPINVDGTDMYANFVYDFEEGYSTYNGETSNYSGSPARVSVRLGMGVTFSKMD